MHVDGHRLAVGRHRLRGQRGGRLLRASSRRPRRRRSWCSARSRRSCSAGRPGRPPRGRAGRPRPTMAAISPGDRPPAGVVVPSAVSMTWVSSAELRSSGSSTPDAASSAIAIRSVTPSVFDASVFTASAEPGPEPVDPEPCMPVGSFTPVPSADVRAPPCTAGIIFPDRPRSHGRTGRTGTPTCSGSPVRSSDPRRRGSRPDRPGGPTGAFRLSASRARGPESAGRRESSRSGSAGIPAR